MIYFDAEAKTRILNWVAQQMRKDGCFFLRAAETIAFLTEAFLRIAVGKTPAISRGSVEAMNESESADVTRNSAGHLGKHVVGGLAGL